MIIDKDGYLSRRTSKGIYRNWFLIKYQNPGEVGGIAVSLLVIPKKYIGKRVRIKVEIEELKEDKKDG